MFCQKKDLFVFDDDRASYTARDDGSGRIK